MTHSIPDINAWIADEWCDTSDWLKKVLDRKSSVNWPPSVIAKKHRKLEMLAEISQLLESEDHGKLKVLDLFSGIGGFSLGLERTGGFETVAFCEIEDYPRRVLKKHWPEVPCYEDVTKLTGDILKRDGISVNVITGGFPCQDISVAGRLAGITEKTRSGLWSEIIRLVGELRPEFVIVENVSNLLSGPKERRGAWFGRVLGDLAECGYNAEWRSLYGWQFGKPHNRERIWIVAYSDSLKLDGSVVPEPPIADQKKSCRRELAGAISEGLSFDDYTRIDRTDDGFLAWVDRFKSHGNSVIPDIPEHIGRAILEAINNDR